MKPGDIATIYPVDYRNALVRAGAARDGLAIDRLTDELARMGLCRFRTDNTHASAAQETAVLVASMRLGGVQS